MQYFDTLLKKKKEVGILNFILSMISQNTCEKNRQALNKRLQFLL